MSAPSDIDLAALRRYRLGRLQAELQDRGLAACLLFDPINMRYAAGTRNYQVQQMHMPCRSLLVPAEGKAIAFELAGWSGEIATPETVAEVRPSTAMNHFFAGPRLAEHADRWAAETADLLRQLGGSDRRLAIDRFEPTPAQALAAQGITAVDAQDIVELARAVKSPEEIACMGRDIAVAERGIARMREALEPGMTENQLWALLHETNIAAGGEWIECRLLASGPRSNPWGAECSDRVIEAGDLVAFDTDMIGPLGICADISRTLLCRPGRPSDAQKRLYRTAVDQIDHNLALLRPGVSFREVCEKSWPIPEIYAANRYPQIAHGIGLCDEYPAIPARQDWAARGYDGVIAENMTFCVESYVGAEGGAEGVKLERQALVTGDGPRLLDSFPYEDDLLS